MKDQGQLFGIRLIVFDDANRLLETVDIGDRRGIVEGRVGGGGRERAGREFTFLVVVFVVAVGGGYKGFGGTRCRLGGERQIRSGGGTVDDGNDPKILVVVNLAYLVGVGTISSPKLVDTDLEQTHWK